MTIKELLFQEIESTPEKLLEETLDFLRFLKTKRGVQAKDAMPKIPSTQSPSQNKTQTNKQKVLTFTTLMGQLLFFTDNSKLFYLNNLLPKKKANAEKRK